MDKAMIKKTIGLHLSEIRELVKIKSIADSMLVLNKAQYNVFVFGA